MLEAKNNRYLRTVHKVAVVPAHIISTQMDECTVMNPEWLVDRIKTAALTAPPVAWSICRGLHV
eukprot:6492214-Amphidinium_carterae.2